MSNFTNGTEEEALRCYLFNDEAPGTWGACCEDLAIVPKPIWVVFLLSVPIEAVLAGADVRATAGMYEEKDNRTALIFLLYNFVTLGTLAYQFDWTSCEASVEGVWECYQGLLFMFYNSTAALASMTLWMLIIMRKFYPQLYFVTRLVISPRFLWRWFDKLNLKNGGTHATLQRWHMISSSTKLYWYNQVGIVVTLLFGGITHILPMFAAYPYILITMCIALIYSHSVRLGYTGRKNGTNLSSTVYNILVFYPVSLVVSTLFLALSPLSLLLKLCGIHSMDKKDDSLPMISPEEQDELELFFKTSKGGLVTLEFNRNESVLAVLPKVQEMLGFDFIERTIHLTFEGQELEESDTITLAQYGIKSGDTLDIVIDPIKLEIRVRLENGNLIVVKMESQASVAVLMNELAKRTGIKQNGQYLLLNGEELESSLVLSRIGLTDDTELELYQLRITISVTLSNRGIVRATVERDSLVRDLLEIIAQRENTTPEFVRLRMNDVDLDANASMHVQGLTHDSELVSIKEVEVRTRLENGEEVTVRLDVRSQVVDLMRELAGVSGLRIESQYLLFEGEQINEESTLEEFENHTFDLFDIDITVTVRLTNGDTAQLQVKRNDEYYSLRELVASLEDTTADLIHVIFNAAEPDDEQTLHEAGLTSGSIVDCSRMVRVNVDLFGSLGNESFEMELDSKATVDELKTRLLKDHNVALTTYLFVMDKQVKDGKKEMDAFSRTEFSVEVYSETVTVTVVNKSTGDKTQVTVDRTATYDELRAEIAKLNGVSAEDIQLFFPRLNKGDGGEPIDGSSTLHEDVGVRDGEVIELEVPESEEEEDEAFEDDDEEVLDESIVKTSKAKKKKLRSSKKGGKARESRGGGGGGGAILSSLGGAFKQAGPARKRIAPESRRRAYVIPPPPLAKPPAAPAAAKSKPKPKFEQREEKKKEIEPKLRGKRDRKQLTKAPAEERVVLESRRRSGVEDSKLAVPPPLEEGKLEQFLDFDEFPEAETKEGDFEEVAAATKEEVEEDKRAKKAERRRERRRRVLMYIKDILRNLCMFDPNGKVIMFAAATTFLCFTFSANYALILYSGAPYLDVIGLDWNARDSLQWFECTASNFVDFSAFGLIDFLGLAVGTVASLLELVDFLASI